MTKADMVRCTAEAAGEQLKTTEAVVNAFLNQIAMALAAGEKVQLIGFGSFEVRDRKSRIGEPAKKSKFRHTGCRPLRQARC